MQQAKHKYLIKLNRNNTNFTAELFEYFKNISAAPVTIYSFLKYYQNIIRAYIEDVDIDSRGLLIYQTMGLGKSILAIAIALDLIKERQVILLLTKSLQENMRTSIHKYVDMRRKSEPDYYLGRFDKQELEMWIKANFSLVSMNASNMLKQLSRATEGHSADEFNAAIDALGINGVDVQVDRHSRS